MKIRRIHLRNLNSLRTEVTVNFNVGALANAGLFAITGDTGAGKTTLLDAITLALFAKTARLHEAEVMSFGSNDAAAEVEFEAKTGIFRAKWGQTRDKKDPAKFRTLRELAQFEPQTGDWLVTASGARDVDSTASRRGQIEEICGLNFDQFCRSALLAQGDFEAFLKASDSDRSALLERLTDTSIYSELSKKAFERAKNERILLERMNEDLDRLDILSAAAIAQLIENQRIAVEKTKTLATGADLLRNNIAWLERLEILEKKAAELAQQQAEIALKKEAATVQFSRLENHRAALPMAAEIHFLDEKTNETSRFLGEIAVLETENSRLENAKTESAKVMAEREIEFSAIKKKQPEAEKLFREMEVLDEKIVVKKDRADLAAAEFELSKTKLDAAVAEFSELKNHQIEVGERLVLDKNWLVDNQIWAKLPEEMPKFQAAIEQMEAIVEDGKGRKGQLDLAEKLQKELAEKWAETNVFQNKLKSQFTDNQSFINEIVEKNDLEHDLESATNSLTERIEKQTAFVASLQILADVAEQHWGLLQELSATNEQLENLEIELHQTERELLSAIDLVAIRREIFEEAGEKMAQMRAILDYAEARKLLVDGQPCPLCGSTEHPLTAHEPISNIFQENLAQAETDFQAAENRLRELGSNARSLADRLNYLGETRAKIEESEAAFLPKIADSLARISDEKAAFANRGELNEIIQIGQQLLDNQRLVRDDFFQKTKIANQLGRQIEAGQSVLNELKLRQSANDETLKILAAEQAKKKADFEKKQAELVAGFAQFDLDFSWQTRVFAFEKLTEKKAFFEQILGRIAENDAAFQGAEMLGKSLSEQILGLKNQAETRQKTAETEAIELGELIKKRKKEFGERSAELERIAFAEHLHDLESQFLYAQKMLENAQHEAIAVGQQLAQKRIQLGENQQKTAEIEQLLTKKWRASGQFESLEALRNALLGNEEAAQIEAFFKTFQEEQTRWEQSFFENKSAVETERSRDFSEKNLGAAQQKLAEIEAERQRLLQETGGLQTRLDDQKARQAKAKMMMQGIENQRITLKKWERLREFIGSADGKKFRAFAQGLTLERLVALANRHLERLHGRYSLRTTGDDLKLEIVDAFQADNVRPMNTLSGGESFLVSLALALGLADLAGRRAQIKSLFIDEGFGTLDESALSLAIQTLDNLQNDGIKIGIVSHVKELKEKIFPQINVFRQGNGISSVRILEGLET